MAFQIWSQVVGLVHDHEPISHMHGKMWFEQYDGFAIALHVPAISHLSPSHAHEYASRVTVQYVSLLMLHSDAS